MKLSKTINFIPIFIAAIAALAATACSKSSSKRLAQEPVTLSATAATPIQVAVVTPVATIQRAVLVDIADAFDAAVGGVAARQTLIANLSANAKTPVLIPVNFGLQNYTISTTFGDLVDQVHGIIHRLLMQFPAGDSRGLVFADLPLIPASYSLFQTADGSVIIHGWVSMFSLHTYYFGRVSTSGASVEATSPVRSDVTSYSISEIGDPSVGTPGWNPDLFSAGDVVYTGYGPVSGIKTVLSQIVIKTNGFVTLVYNYTPSGK